jgi:hypothetical protein
MLYDNIIAFKIQCEITNLKLPGLTARLKLTVKYLIYNHFRLISWDCFKVNKILKQFLLNGILSKRFLSKKILLIKGGLSNFTTLLSIKI